MTTATTTEGQQTTAKPPRASPVRVALGKGNEAILAAMKAAVKAPGTDLGVLTRSLETRLRDLKALIDAKGSVATMEGALGRVREVPVTVSAVVAFAVQVGDDDPDLYAFSLVPGIDGALPFNLRVGRVVTHGPPPTVPEVLEMREEDGNASSPLLYLLRPTTRTPHQVQVGAEPWPSSGLAWWRPDGADGGCWLDTPPGNHGVPPGVPVWAVPVGRPEEPPAAPRPAADMGPSDDPTATTGRSEPEEFIEGDRGHAIPG